jgi:two-component system, NarL family, invasion response regulator UvrY
MSLKVLIADDHALLRKGLAQVLANELPEAVFGEASTTAETSDRLAAERWDVLILDIFMPGRGGLEVLAEARRRYPSLPVLVLSSAPEEQLAVRVLKAGASGYLNKQAAPEELVSAVRRLKAGGRYVSASVADRLVQEVGRANDVPHERLSDREYEVLCRVVAGKSIKQIADELGLSAKTISTFHTRIWEKLGVKSDVELVRYAIDNHLADTVPDTPR